MVSYRITCEWDWLGVSNIRLVSHWMCISLKGVSLKNLAKDLEKLDQQAAVQGWP